MLRLTICGGSDTFVASPPRACSSVTASCPPRARPVGSITSSTRPAALRRCPLWQIPAQLVGHEIGRLRRGGVIGRQQPQWELGVMEFPEDLVVGTVDVGARPDRAEEGLP